MPIQFRCPVCRKKLSISQRKAGAQVTCPACGSEIRVPDPERGEIQEKEHIAPPMPEAFDGAAATVADNRRGNGWEDEDDEGFQLSRRFSPDDELDMTPMVDVTFLLLIFFMVTASFSLQKSLQTEAPDDEREGFAQLPQVQDLADESVIVEIDENDAIFVDDEPVGGPGDLPDILRRKMSAEQKREMIIEPHYQAKHGTVVAVTDAGIEVGMQRIRRASRSTP